MSKARGREEQGMMGEGVRGGKLATLVKTPQLPTAAMQTVIVVFSQNSPTRIFLRAFISSQKGSENGIGPHPLPLPHPSSLNLPILIHDSGFDKGDIQ